MKTIIASIVLAATVACGQEPVAIDISEICHGATNMLYLYPMTNAWNTAVATNVLPDSVEYMVDHGTLTNVVKQLAKEGHICAVIGHQWRDGRPGEGEGSADGGWYADYHPGVFYRTCRICGKCESQTLEDWK